MAVATQNAEERRLLLLVSACALGALSAQLRGHYAGLDRVGGDRTPLHAAAINRGEAELRALAGFVLDLVRAET